MNKSQKARLVRAYAKKFKALDKSFFQDQEIGLAIFIEYLKYIHDSLATNLALGALDNYDQTKAKTASITIALAEFDAYKACQDETKKNFHWNNFWELVKLNMEEWITSNDSI